MVLVGGVDFLDKTVMSFVRLAEGTMLEEMMEVGSLFAVSSIRSSFSQLTNQPSNQPTILPTNHPTYQPTYPQTF